jgi:hypothetical protein
MPDDPNQDQATDRGPDADGTQDIIRRFHRTLHRPAHPARARRKQQAFQKKQDTHTDEEVGERYGPHRMGTSRLNFLFQQRCGDIAAALVLATPDALLKVSAQRRQMEARRR